MSVFRYLRIVNGYQRGAIFSGFKESGFWEVNPISPVLVEVNTGTSTSVPIFITRTDLNDEIELKILNLPLGVTASFSPAVLAPGQTSATLKLTNVDSLSPATNVIVAGLPAPRKVGQFQIKTGSGAYWEFGVPYETGTTTTTQSTGNTTTTTQAPSYLANIYYTYTTSATPSQWSITFTAVARRGTIPYNYTFTPGASITRTVTLNRVSAQTQQPTDGENYGSFYGDSVYIGTTSEPVYYTTNMPEAINGVTGGAHAFSVPLLGQPYTGTSGNWGEDKL